MIEPTAEPGRGRSVGGTCASVVAVAVVTGDEYSYDPEVPVRERTEQVWAVLTARPVTVAADVDPTISVHPLDVGLAVGSHLYSKCAAAPADGLSSQSSAIDVPAPVAVRPVGRQGPEVVCVTAPGAADVKSVFSPRNQTV